MKLYKFTGCSSVWEAPVRLTSWHGMSSHRRVWHGVAWLPHGPNVERHSMAITTLKMLWNAENHRNNVGQKLNSLSPGLFCINYFCFFFVVCFWPSGNVQQQRQQQHELQRRPLIKYFREKLPPSTRVFDIFRAQERWEYFKNWTSPSKRGFWYFPCTEWWKFSKKETERPSQNRFLVFSVHRMVKIFKKNNWTSPSKRIFDIFRAQNDEHIKKKKNWMSPLKRVFDNFRCTEWWSYLEKKKGTSFVFWGVASKF